MQELMECIECGRIIKRNSAHQKTCKGFCAEERLRRRSKEYHQNNKAKISASSKAYRARQKAPLLDTMSKAEREADRKLYKEWYANNGGNAGMLHKRDGTPSPVPTLTEFERKYFPLPEAAIGSWVEGASVNSQGYRTEF